MLDTGTNRSSDVSARSDNGAAQSDAASSDNDATASTEDAGAPPAGTDVSVVEADGERCETAWSLADISKPLGPETGWAFNATSSFGDSNDYNPYMDSGLQPGCAMVWDAVGNDVVASVELQPGETLIMEYAVEPDNVPGGLYVVDSCPVRSWPDNDGSGACGDNEYQSQGFCAFSCVPLQLSVTHPAVDADGNPTTTQTYWVVMDWVGATAGTSWSLNWRIAEPTPPEG